MILRQSQLEENFRMNTFTKTFVLAVVVTLGHLGIAPSAYAVTISIAEVRDNMAYVKGSDAGRKQQILWEGTPVTKANGKGNFNFEGDLPTIDDDGNYIGTLTAGGDSIDVLLDYQPNEPPGEPIDELVLKYGIPDSHDGDAVRAVGFVMNGEEVQVVSGGADASLRNWTLELSQPPVIRYLDHIIYDIDVVTDILATGEGGWNGHAGSPTLRLWKAFGSPLTETQAPIGFVYSVTVSPDKYWIAASGFYGDLLMYRNQPNTEEPYDLELFSTTITKKKRTKALAFSPDGGFLASASTGGIQIRSFPQGCALDDCELDLHLTLSHSGSWSFSIAFAPHSTSERIEMVSGTDSGKTKLWIIENPATEDPTVSVSSIDSGAVYALAWSPDRPMIVVGGNRDITVYDSTDLSILFRNEDAHAGRVNDVAFSPNSSMIISGGADGALKLWEFPTP
jgi:WD40 repeat protein